MISQQSSLYPNQRLVPNPKWYVIHCLSQLQAQIISFIQKKVAEDDLTEMILEIKEVKKMVRSSKTKKIENRNVYPGYIFIKMRMNLDVYNFIRTINGVRQFLGFAGQPTPLSLEEVTRFINRITQKSNQDSQSEIEVDFKPGDYVKILVANFKNRECQVIKINPTNQTVTVWMEMFGRMVATDFNFSDCEKIF